MTSKLGEIITGAYLPAVITFAVPVWGHLTATSNESCNTSSTGASASGHSPPSIFLSLVETRTQWPILGDTVRRLARNTKIGQGEILRRQDDESLN